MANDLKALKSGLWYTVSFFLVRGMSYITTPIFTRLLTKEHYGIYSNYTSWLAILTILITMNLYATLITACYDYKKDLKNYVFSALLLSMLSVGIWMAVLNLLYDRVSQIFMMDRQYINIMLLYLLFLPAIDFYQTQEKYSFKYKKTTAVSILVSCGNILFPLLLIFTMHSRLTALILGSALSTILMGLFLLLFVLGKGSRLKIGYWKYALRYGLPYVPHSLSLMVLSSMDRVMITYFCGAEDTALYSLGYLCGSAASLLLMAVNTAYAPWLAEKLAYGEYDSIRRFSGKYIDMFLALGIGMMFVAPEILMIFGGRAYMEAVSVMVPLTMGSVCQFLYTMYVNIEQCKKKTIGMALASLSAALLNFVLNAVFIPRYGYVAAAYTTLTGYLWLLLMHYLIVKKSGFGNLYSGKKILSALSIAVVVAVSCAFLYTRPFIRYMVIIVYAVILFSAVWRKREIIKSLIKK